jgi:hypothetical protein
MAPRYVALERDREDADADEKCSDATSTLNAHQLSGHTRRFEFVSMGGGIGEHQSIQ